MKGQRFSVRLFFCLVAAWGFFSASCFHSHDEIRDVIQPVRLVAGSADTVLVSDLFYANDYPVVFKSNPYLWFHYEPGTQRLILRAERNFEGFTLLTFTMNGEEYVVPVISRIRQKHIFRHRPRHAPRRRMNVMGSFNDWNRDSLPMHDPDGDGVYELEVELDPGRHLYQFVLDDEEYYDLANPNRVENGFGGYTSVLTVPPRYKEPAVLHVLGYQATAQETRLRFWYERKDQPRTLQSSDVFALLGNQTISANNVTVSGNRIEIRLKRQALHGHTSLRVLVAQGGQTTNIQTIPLSDGVPLADIQSSFSWQDAIVYSILIDRFSDGDKNNDRPVLHDSLSSKLNYMGGDLQGIIDKLDEGYFDSLGINTIWLSPVNDNTEHAYREWPAPHRYVTGYHGYWPVHHQRVEARFGNLALLQELVATAHRHNIKVLLDFIANHVHIDHPFYRQHRDWFGTLELPDGRKNIRFWDEFRLTTWFEPFLPSFDYLGSGQALRVMTDNAVWWLKQTGVDGFRHDAVKHVPHRFWRTLTRKIKREIERPEKRKVFQLGETFGSYKLISSYVNNGQLDAQFNFNLYDTALYVFLTAEADFSVLAAEIQKSFSVYGANHLMGNIMDSHDKVRYMAYADGDLPLFSGDAVEAGWRHPPEVNHDESYRKAELYLAYLLTIPGVPVLYYGDEIGMTGAGDPDNRRMMRFGEQLTAAEKQMLLDVRRLIHLRKNHSALRHGDFQTLLANRNCFAYLRSNMNERVLTVLNKSARTQEVRIRLPEAYRPRTAVDLVDGQSTSLPDSTLSIRVPAFGWKILEIR